MPRKHNNPLSRRQFLAASTAGSAMAASLPLAASATETGASHLLKEHGFWDYTTPGCGGMGEYQKQDYMLLLDDMAAAGMNSLCILVKWLTTGYRSRLPFLDQLPDCPVIASDNRLLQEAIVEAGKRNIKVWIGAVVSYYDAEKFTNAKPWHIFQDMGGYKLPMGVGAYAADEPVLTERAIQIFEELLDIFPGVGGLVVELESSGIEQPERIPRYNQWAKENNRPAFDKLGHPFNPRYFDVTPWRDYTSNARFKLLRELEKALRGKGFAGDLSMICETGSYTNSVVQEVNLQEYRKQFPQWKTITYEYEKYMNRYAMMEFCIETPKQEGLEVYYLPRGIMTWGMKWPLPISLEESWCRDLEDIQMFQPHSVWWFGSGTVGDGTHVSLARIQKSGFRDGVDARRALLRAASGLNTVK
jgi:hypothetical protein